MKATDVPEISDVTTLRGNRVPPGLVSLVQDVRWGLRGLRARPGFTFVAVSMLAIGIGINGAVFTIDRAYAIERNTTVLFGGFAIVALVLAAVGLYGVVAHGVSRRTREIGIRVAVGATRGDILALFLGRGLSAAGVGLLVGLAMSVAVNQLLKSQLAGVSPADPLALVAASVVLVVTAGLGAWVPARRAAQVDPVVALKPDVRSHFINGRHRTQPFRRHLVR